MLTLLLTFKNHLADPKHDLYEGATYSEGSNGKYILNDCCVHKLFEKASRLIVVVTWVYGN